MVMTSRRSPVVEAAVPLEADLDPLALEHIDPQPHVALLEVDGSGVEVDRHPGAGVAQVAVALGQLVAVLAQQAEPEGQGTGPEEARVQVAKTVGDLLGRYRLVALHLDRSDGVARTVGDVDDEVDGGGRRCAGLDPDRDLGLQVALVAQEDEHALALLLEPSVALRAGRGQGLTRPQGQPAQDLVLAQRPVAPHEDVADPIRDAQLDRDVDCRAACGPDGTTVCTERLVAEPAQDGRSSRSTVPTGLADAVHGPRLDEGGARRNQQRYQALEPPRGIHAAGHGDAETRAGGSGGAGGVASGRGWARAAFTPAPTPVTVSTANSSGGSR